MATGDDKQKTEGTEDATNFEINEADAAALPNDLAMGAVQAGMRRKQECDLDLQARDRDQVFTAQQAGGRHGRIEPARDDSTLHDATLGMAFSGMTMPRLGMPFDHDAIACLIVGDSADAEQLPSRWPPGLGLLDQILVRHVW
ncbi:hypothetical protein IVA98_16115 [Bradyrhizobium sp. 160]|uniref:hypothetical protein n=1 Tax=Bradyrhizobium sp. 160 TaxID=2782634 RepID=UPI001FFB6308|nr:hypothetical protein [Bradyrhizobium sp. 160]MCK1624664.1 hypothetical protein [Bradyrhizobium sp. 160]